MVESDNFKKRRQCGSKTRTGCQTCKIRRIKCDEAKPACRRCTSTGRKCDGYIQELSTPNPDEKKPGTVVQRVFTHMPGNSQEKRGFQYFVTHTSAELSGFFDTSFWGHIMLQASAAEPSLRHAVVAIGSLHEEFAHNRFSYHAAQQSKKQVFAISQYTKAIGSLRRALSNGNQEPLTALMSCILFACFDSLRGYFDNAIIHLQSGLKILNDYKPRSAEDAYIVERHITPLFLRLSIQSILYIDTRSTPERARLGALTAVCSKELEVPEEFETLEEARQLMNQSAHGLFRMFYMCEYDKAMQDQPPLAKEMFLRYTQQMSAWNRSFEKFMAAKSHTLNSKELRGAAMLKIHQLVSTIMRDVTPDETDTRGIATSVNDRKKFGRFTSDFRIVVNLAKSLIEGAEQDQKMGKAAFTFSTDLGLVGPLYYVCIRCADQTIKLQSLELLHRLPRREGMWDSESATQMIKEYWEIEQRHVELQEVSEGQASSVPFSDIVNLVFGDGMRWEWKWKFPLGKVPVTLKRDDGSDFITTFTDDWKDLLEDQSWFTEDFSMDTGVPSGIDNICGMDALSGTDSGICESDLENSLGTETMFGTDFESSLGTASVLESELSSSPEPSTTSYMPWSIPATPSP